MFGITFTANCLQSPISGNGKLVNSPFFVFVNLKVEQLVGCFTRRGHFHIFFKLNPIDLD